MSILLDASNNEGNFLVIEKLGPKRSSGQLREIDDEPSADKSNNTS